VSSTHAGPEIGVASTKAFTTQIVALISIIAQECCAHFKEQVAEAIQELIELPGNRHTDKAEQLLEWAKNMCRQRIFCISRGSLSCRFEALNSKKSRTSMPRVMRPEK
jgi:glucosamine--fructose-6-phosphate aminotransferase (isomerizing)